MSNTTDLVPFQAHHAGSPETETVNANVAMAGLSVHTQRAYRRWIARYLCDVNKISKKQIDFNNISIPLTVSSLGPAPLKAWLGALKASKLGKQSIMQAKAAVVWLSQLMADLGRSDYEVPAGLSRVKAPRAESGQRQGTWLAQEEIKQLLRGVRRASGTPEKIVRNVCIVTLMVTCGLRRDEVAAATWGDLSRQGRNNILKVHGKGEKMRVVKLPDMTVLALEEWRKMIVASRRTIEPTTPLFSRIWRNGRITYDGISDKSVWLIIQQASKAAGLQKISPHDLRRSFARGAFEAGVSFELIRQSLGHSSIATTERYVNSVLELDQSATDIWATSLIDLEGDIDLTSTT